MGRRPGAKVKRFRFICAVVALLLVGPICTAVPAYAQSQDSFSQPFLNSTASVYMAALHRAVTKEIDAASIIGGPAVLNWDWSYVRPTRDYSGLFTSLGGRPGIRAKIRETYVLKDDDPSTDITLAFGVADASSLQAAVGALKAEAKSNFASTPKLSSTKTSTWLSVSAKDESYGTVDTLVGLAVNQGSRAMIIYSICYRLEDNKPANRCTIKQLESAVSRIAFSLPPLGTRVISAGLDIPSSISPRLQPIAVSPLNAFEITDVMDSDSVFIASFGTELPRTVEPYLWTATSMTFHVSDQKRLTVKAVVIPIGSSPSPINFPNEICVDTFTKQPFKNCASTPITTPSSVLSGRLRHSRIKSDSSEVFEAQVVTATRFISIGCGREDYGLLTKSEQSACSDAITGLVNGIATG